MPLPFIDSKCTPPACFDSKSDLPSTNTTTTTNNSLFPSYEPPPHRRTPLVTGISFAIQHSQDNNTVAQQDNNTAAQFRALSSLKSSTATAMQASPSLFRVTNPPSPQSPDTSLYLRCLGLSVCLPARPPARLPVSCLTDHTLPTTFPFHLMRMQVSQPRRKAVNQPSYKPVNLTTITSPP